MRLAHRGPQVRAKTVGAALVDRVAGLALLEHLGALGRVRACEIELDRLLGFAALALRFNALDRIAHRLRTFAVEHLASDNRAAERDDAGEQDPARDGVVAIVHGSDGSGKRVGIWRPFRGWQE